MSVGITGLYAGVLVVMMVVLSLKVVQNRVRARVGMGSGDDAQLERSIRVHANFTENVPLCLILFALLELSGVSEYLLHGLGAMLVVARVAHAYGLGTNPNLSHGRKLGMIGTYTVQVVCGFMLVGQFLTAL